MHSGRSRYAGEHSGVRVFARDSNTVWLVVREWEASGVRMWEPFGVYLTPDDAVAAACEQRDSVHYSDGNEWVAVEIRAHFDLPSDE